MEFNKTYNITSIVDELTEKKEIINYKTKYFKELYMAIDVWDIWIYRVYDATLIDKNGYLLLETNKLSKESIYEYAIENYNYSEKLLNLDTRSAYKSIKDKDLMEIVILVDNSTGLESYDTSSEYTSLEEIENDISFSSSNNVIRI